MLLDNQIIPIYKPLYYTSFDAIRYLQREYGFKKIGHAGTLDPLAKGLLLVCTGSATKQINLLMGQDKEYLMELTVGAETASFDRETIPRNFRPFAHLNPELIKQTLQSFVGEIQQSPPIYSAVKKNGRRLYEYARAGKDIEIPTRLVRITSIELLNINLPIFKARITCSKGTYIRSLARDMGEQLNCGAYLSMLERTKIGKFTSKDALKVLPERLEWQARYIPSEHSELNIENK